MRTASVWTGLSGLALVLLGAIALGPRLLGDAEPRAAALASTGAYARYVAPDSVCPGARDADASVARQQGTMVCLLNYARREHGLAPLAAQPTLMVSAKIKADDIVRCREFSHTACDATTLSAFERAGYVNPYVSSRYGENLAWGAADAGSQHGALLGWLESDEHRENLFRAEWTEQGIALAYAADFRGVGDSRVWVSHFGHRG